MFEGAHLHMQMLAEQVFDLLHAGHVHSLRSATRFGAVRIVGGNADSSVAELKGPERRPHRTRIKLG